VLNFSLSLCVYLIFNIMASNEKTSGSVETKASKLLSNPNTPKNVKSVAGSALTQAPDHKKSSKK